MLRYTQLASLRFVWQSVEVKNGESALHLEIIEVSRSTRLSMSDQLRKDIWSSAPKYASDGPVLLVWRSLLDLWRRRRLQLSLSPVKGPASAGWLHTELYHLKILKVFSWFEAVCGPWSIFGWTLKLENEHAPLLQLAPAPSWAKPNSLNHLSPFLGYVCEILGTCGIVCGHIHANKFSLVCKMVVPTSTSRKNNTITYNSNQNTIQPHGLTRTAAHTPLNEVQSMATKEQHGHSGVRQTH